MKLVNWIVVTVLFVAVVSCNNSEKEAYISEVDGMIVRLDSLKEIADANVLDSLPFIIDRIKKNTKRFAASYKGDTIDLQIGEMINLYKSVRKGLSRNSGNLAKVRVSIPETVLALTNLKSDISNGVGERDKYQEHILFEKDKVDQIDTLLTVYLKNNEEYLSLYEELNVKIGKHIREQEAVVE